ncbi:unnamed protein product, partial [Candidula unifasciata]
SSGKNLAAMTEVFPLQQTSNNELSPDNILLYDDDDNGVAILDDAELGSLMNSYSDDQPVVFAKRGRYYNRNQGHTKRNSPERLNQKIDGSQRELIHRWPDNHDAIWHRQTKIKYLRLVFAKENSLKL